MHGQQNIKTCLLKFQDRLSVPFSGNSLTLKMELICCPVMSVNNYPHALS